MSASTSTWQDWSLLVFCNFIWASQFMMVKLVQLQLGPIAATLLPIAVATIVLVPIVLHERSKRAGSQPRTARTTRPWQAIWQFAALGLFGQVAAQLCITWGMRHASATLAAVLMLMLPVITAVMSRSLLGERMTRIRWFAFAVAIVGAAACSGIDWSGFSVTDSGAMLGTGLVLLSMCGSAFYNVYSKRMLIGYSPLEVLLYSYYAVLAFLIPIAWVIEPETYTHIGHLTVTTVAGIGVLAIFQYAISMVAFLSVLSRLKANQAALGNYLIPFFGVVIAAVFLGERLEWPIIVGGVLVLASTILATLGENRLSGAPRPSPPGGAR